MRFGESVGVERDDDDDWFDPHVTVDTKLFIDPILLLDAGGEWEEAHAELVGHFAHCYEMVAHAPSRTSVSAAAARRLLTFPEPREFCLGYTNIGTSGSGSGDRFAQQMIDGIAVAIAAGLRVPEHGRGPVDFKISSGSSVRLLLEVKKAHNGKFWQGLDAQLPSYLKSDDCEAGWFVAIRYRSNKASEVRMDELPGRVRRCAAATVKRLRYAAVDARPRESASKL